jgi:hypothetical protein
MSTERLNGSKKYGRTRILRIAGLLWDFSLFATIIAIVIESLEVIVGVISSSRALRGVTSESGPRKRAGVAFGSANHGYPSVSEEH